MTLAASSITRTGATLTITGHTAAWYWQRRSVAPGPCTAVAANTATATLTGLTAATAYTYKAYSDSTCATELTTDATDAEFTTPGIVLSAPKKMGIVEGSSATYTVKLATQPSSAVTITVTADILPGLTVDTDPITSGDQSTLTFTNHDWSTARVVTVTVTANDNSLVYIGSQRVAVHNAASSDSAYEGASAAYAVTAIGSATPVLSASSVTATGATLSITNQTGGWHYRGLVERGEHGACTSVAANTATVTLSGLAPGTAYTFHPHPDSACIRNYEYGYRASYTAARFTTPGVMLSALKLIAPEGATAAYTARLATEPAGNVTVTVTRGAGSDTDLTVDTDPSRSGNQNTLTFTAANWDVPQTVTVAAAEETDSTDKAYGTATFSHSATSGYTTTAASTLTVTEGDNDVCPGTTAVGGATVTTGGLVDDCNTLLAAKTMLAGTSTAIDNWATTLAIGSWSRITVANNRVTEIGFDSSDYGLNGAIPNTLGNLTNLEKLTVRYDEFSGPIPAELGNLTNLEELWLGRYSSTNSYHVDYGLSGQIPAELGNLTNLTHLSLGSNALSGPVPAELGNLTNLTLLSLGDNALSGPVPAELGNLANLDWLHLSNNALSGQVPAELGNLTNLTRLNLGSNALSGPVPAELGNLTNLTRLNLGSNALSGPVPAGLGNLTNLEWLDLRFNALSGPVPAELGNLTNLEWLDLGSNALSGPVPAELGNLTNLEGLFLLSNALSGPVPAGLASLTNLNRLNLSNNALSGPVPAGLGNLTNLEYLSLQSNNLSGSIPAELGNLTNLEGLYMFSNNLSGSIPAELGNLTETRALLLSGNALSGPIPAELGNLTKTVRLWLRGNALSGPIPAEFGNLTNLEWLHLDDNYLAGCLPSNWHKYATDSDQDSYALNPQRAGKTLGVCDGIVLSDARPSVGEGSTADYTVRLSSAPSSTVTVTVSATGDSDITVDTNTTTGGNQDTLTFTTQNWATAQTVRLSAAQDTDAVHGTATLTHTAASSDSTYSGTMATAVATEADDETGLNAVSVSATSAWLVGSRSPYRQSSPSQGTCASPPGRLSFSQYWDGRFEVTGLSPNTAYTFKAYVDSSCSSERTTDATDAEFATASGVLLSRTHLNAAEGSTATYTVELATAPTHGVTVALTKDTGGDADLTFDPSSLSFTTGNWDTAQTVTVTAASDTDTDDGAAVLVHTPSSSDLKYNSSPASIKVYERDNNAVLSSYAVWAGLPGRAVLLIDNHAGAWYYKRSAPTAGACSAKIAAGTVAATVAGLAPGTSYTFKAYSDSSCTTELTADATDAEFTTPPAEEEEIELSASSLTVAEGTSQTYTVRLAAAPSQNVAVTIAKATGGDADLNFNPSTLSFTTQNWATAQTVTVTAAQENRSDAANGTATLRHTAVSADSDYDGLITELAVSEADDDLCPGSTAVGGAAVTSGGLVDDCAALLGARLVLAGASGVSALNWSANRDIGQWHGVTVSGGRVTGVDLPGAGLDGTLSSVLGDLDALVSLDLEGNSLTGPIPAQLSALTGLATLKLSGNSLSGCVPAGLAGLEMLASTPGSTETFEINPQNTANGSVDLPTCSGIVVSDASPTVNEGGSVDYSVSLSTQPAGDVTVTLSTAAPSTSASVGQPGNAQAQGATAQTQGSVAQAQTQTVDSSITIDTDPDTAGDQSTLMFTPGNWSVTQTVRVTAAADDDGASSSVVINHTASSTGDSDYDGVVASSTATEADNDRALTAEWVSNTEATLTISNYTDTDAWYYKRTVPTGGTCSSVTAGTRSVKVTGLSPSTGYTFKAYSDQSCSTELTSDDTDAEFTTLAFAPAPAPPTDGNPGGGGGGGGRRRRRRRRRRWWQRACGDAAAVGH